MFQEQDKELIIFIENFIQEGALEKRFLEQVDNPLRIKINEIQNPPLRSVFLTLEGLKNQSEEKEVIFYKTIYYSVSIAGIVNGNLQILRIVTYLAYSCQIKIS